MNVLALFAHPDDAEFLCAGTLAHLANRGAKIRIVTMTAGDAGSTLLPPKKIASVRLREAQRAAKLIGAHYSCLFETDLNVFYDKRTLAKVMEAVRAADPRIVFTHSPVDYMVDHENTSRLCQTACFGAMAGNVRTGVRHAAKPIRAVPHLYYAEPFGGRDIMGQQILSTVFVDISVTSLRKQRMLACHESQRSFLSAQQGISDMVDVAQAMAARAGRAIGWDKAEGFRQHLGQGFPQDNVLSELLHELVRQSRSPRAAVFPAARTRPESQ